MANGFLVKETIERPTGQVWAYLTDFGRASEWMAGVEDMRPTTDGRLESEAASGSRPGERNAKHRSRCSNPKGESPSIQGGVTATYTYSLEPAGTGTEVTLNAVCSATGFWKLLHPIIVLAMRKSDSTHLVKLKTAITKS